MKIPRQPILSGTRKSIPGSGASLFVLPIKTPPDFAQPSFPPLSTTWTTSPQHVHSPTVLFCCAIHGYRALSRTHPKHHGLGICEYSKKSTLGVVSLLRSASGGGRTIQGLERLSASLVSEFVICLLGFGATGIFARRRAVMAPRECTHSAIL